MSQKGNYIIEEVTRITPRQFNKLLSRGKWRRLPFKVIRKQRRDLSAIRGLFRVYNLERETWGLYAGLIRRRRPVYGSIRRMTWAGSMMRIRKHKNK